ncbi:MAG TPA: glycosyltransferase family 4 protein [Desulfomonilaceae bacterium]|nr:glycosyltransferase family 4 protein [Desulfomonilaceae bacterium]
MNIVHLSTFDKRGGAAKAAYRLHTYLKGTGVQSRMIVREKAEDDFSVTSLSKGPCHSLFLRVGQKIDRLALHLYPKREKIPWSTNRAPNSIVRRLEALNPDIVHLHWVGDGLLPIRALPRFRWPVVWTLHDLWPITGGCHLPGNCERYTESCGRCPRLGSGRERDITKLVWEQKEQHWKSVDITLVAASRWVAECARASSLFRRTRAEVIPLGLDLQVFKPMDKSWARKKLNWPQEKHIILMGAFGLFTDPLKGFHHMIDAAKILNGQGWAEKAELVLFGTPKTEALPPAIGLRTTYMGPLHDDKLLSLVYSAADVFVCPSKQETFGQTVLESMACGTPCVAFGTGGLLDLVEHGVTGYLAEPQNTADLAYGIAWALENDDRRRRLSQTARDKVEKHFSSGQVARRYVELYRTLQK